MAIDSTITLLKANGVLLNTSRGLVPKIVFYPTSTDYSFSDVKAADLSAGYPLAVANLCHARRTSSATIGELIYSPSTGIHHSLDHRYSLCPPDIFGLPARSFDWAAYRQTVSAYDFVSRYSWPTAADASFVPGTGESFEPSLCDATGARYLTGVAELNKAMVKDILTWLWGQPGLDTSTWTVEMLADPMPMASTAFDDYADTSTGYSVSPVTYPTATNVTNVFLALPVPTGGAGDVVSINVWHVTIPEDVFAGCYTLGYRMPYCFPNRESAESLRSKNFGLTFCFVDTIFGGVFVNKWAPTTAITNRATVGSGTEGPLLNMIPGLPASCESPTPLTSKKGVGRYWRLSAIGCPEFVDGYTIVGPSTFADPSHATIVESAIGFDWRGSTLAAVAANANSGTQTDRDKLALIGGKSFWSAAERTVPAGLIARLTSLGDYVTELPQQLFAAAEDGRPALTFGQAETNAVGSKYRMVHRLASVGKLEVPRNAAMRLLIDGSTGSLTWMYQASTDPAPSPADSDKVAELLITGCTIVNTSSMSLEDAVNELLTVSIAQVQSQRDLIGCAELNEAAMFAMGLADTDLIGDNMRAGFELLQFGRPRTALSNWLNASLSMGRYASRTYKLSTY